MIFFWIAAVMVTLLWVVLMARIVAKHNGPDGAAELAFVFIVGGMIVAFGWIMLLVAWAVQHPWV